MTYISIPTPVSLPTGPDRSLKSNLSKWSCRLERHCDTIHIKYNNMDNILLFHIFYIIYIKMFI